MIMGFESDGCVFVISSGSDLYDRELMVVQQSGEGGRGTSSPATKLDVKGDISASGDIQISSSVIKTAGISGSGTISGFTSASIASGSFDGISIGNASPPPGNELVVEGNISSSGFLSIEGNVTASGRLTDDGVANFGGSFVNIGGGFGSTGASIADDGDIATNDNVNVDVAIIAS